MLDTHSPEHQEFALQLGILANLLRIAKYQVLPFKDELLPLYSELSASQQREVLKNLKAYCTALEDVLLHDVDINSTRLVWRFLIALGIFPKEDFFNTVREESHLQIFNFDQFQIFRTLPFFANCSFTLEELLCRPWWQLWKRNRAELHIISELSKQSLISNHPSTIRLDLPFEKSKEIGTDGTNEHMYRIKSATALTKGGHFHSVLLVEEWAH